MTAGAIFVLVLGLWMIALLLAARRRHQKQAQGNRM